MKKRKEPVFTIGSFFGSKFEMFFRCKKTYRADLQSVMKPLPLLSPFALFPSLLKIHRSPIHHKQLLITIIPPFPLALSTFYQALKNSPFTYSQYSSPSPTLSLGSFYFLPGSCKFTIHHSPFTIHHSLIHN